MEGWGERERKDGEKETVKEKQEGRGSCLETSTRKEAESAELNNTPSASRLPVRSIHPSSNTLEHCPP